MNNELSNCPECGYHSPDYSLKQCSGHPPHWGIVCPRCGYALRGAATPEEAVNQWNTEARRKVPAAQMAAAGVPTLFD